jgi:hypothetical protein
VWWAWKKKKVQLNTSYVNSGMRVIRKCMLMLGGIGEECIKVKMKMEMEVKMEDEIDR